MSTAVECLAKISLCIDKLQQAQETLLDGKTTIAQINDLVHQAEAHARVAKAEALAMHTLFDALMLKQGVTYVIGAPYLSLPPCFPVGPISIQAQAQHMLNNMDVEKFHLTIPELGIYKEYGALANKAALDFIIPENIADAQELSLTVYASDGLGNRSKPTVHIVKAIGKDGIQPARIIDVQRYNNDTDAEPDAVTMPEVFVANMSVKNGTDTPQAKRVQIAATPDFMDLIWDSNFIAPDAKAICDVTLEPACEYYARAKWQGATLGETDWGPVFIFATAKGQGVGVAQNATGKLGQVMQRIDVNGQLVLDKPDFDNHPVYANIKTELIDGQHMVGFDKFFFKRGLTNSAALDAWTVSDIALPGFELHPAFLAKDGVTPLDRIYIGKYQASVEGGTKLASLPGVIPQGSKTLAQFQALANARNTANTEGFHVWNVHELAMIQLLMLIEYAGTDFQTLIGMGHCTGSAVAAVDNTTVAQASWRGLVGLWGNVWQLCDGFRKKSDGIYIDMGKGLVKTNVIINADNFYYPNTIHKGRDTGFSIDHIFIGKKEDSTSAADSATYPDGQLYSTINSDNVLLAGGGHINGTSAGLFYMCCNSAPTTSRDVYSTRLAKY